MMQPRVESICDKIIEEKKWRPFKDREVTITSGGFPVSAHISLNDRRIHLSFSDEFESLIISMIQKHELRMEADTAFEAIVYHLLVHEFNHHHYCPGNAFLFQQILDGIRAVVEMREIRESRIKSVCFEIHNMFADTVINAIESHDDQSNRYRTGQDLTNLLALYYRSQGKVLRGRCDKAMTLFLESNSLLSSTSDKIYEKSKRYLPLLFWNEERALERLVEVFLEEQSLIERTLARDLLDSDSGEIVKRMCDYKQWHARAEDYARVIYPYMKQQYDWLKNSFTGKTSEKAEGGNLEGSDHAGSEREDAKTEPDTNQNSKPQEPQTEKGKGAQADENTRDSDDGAPDGQGESTGYSDDDAPEDQYDSSAQGPHSGAHTNQIAEDDYSENAASNVDEEIPEQTAEKGEKAARQDSGSEKDGKRNSLEAQEDAQNSRGPGPDKKKSNNLSKPSGRRMGEGSHIYKPHDLAYERLDSFYEERAGDIKLEDWESDGQNLEVMTGIEDADLSSISKLRLPSSFVLKRPDGSMYLSLKGRRFSLTLDARVKENMSGLPDLCFVFDSSGSMSFKPYVEQGEYHIALLTFYSILHGLAAKGIAPLLMYNAVNFSDTTFASGWHPFYEIDEVKRILLQHQGGGTTIDVDKLSAIRRERRDNYLLFLLSDLQITNFSALETELIETHASRAAYVLLFKLGGKDLLCSRLERAGITVLYPGDGEDFMYGSIKITREVYSGAL